MVLQYGVANIVNAALNLLQVRIKLWMDVKVLCQGRRGGSERGSRQLCLRIAKDSQQGGNLGACCCGFFLYPTRIHQDVIPSNIFCVTISFFGNCILHQVLPFWATEYFSWELLPFMQTSTWAELSQQRATESLVLWALHHLQQVVISLLAGIFVTGFVSSLKIHSATFSGFVILGSSLPAPEQSSPSRQSG